MLSKRISFQGLLIGTILGGAVLTTQATPPKVTKALSKVDFDRDVRPILSENCFVCHGFDAKKRQANLRLDVPEGAFQKRADGKAPIVAGKPGQSSVIERIRRTDGLQMPPKGSNKHVTPQQLAILEQWVRQGAQYEPHWAFVAPKRVSIPTVKNVLWSRNAIDQFLLAGIEQEGLQPSPEADRRTLIRRLSLDLRGLLPSPVEVDTFLKDSRPNAYERLVEKYLADTHYGERMALQWLDLARYADTHGYHIDSHRDMWRWRDWVISSFNKNLSYDKFLTYQIAGDLIPNATLEQKIATGFSRNHPINFEGGAIPEEYQTAYVTDRVDCFSTAILGMSLRCGQCHNHKYDPFTQKEYYQLFAYFNNIKEVGLDGTKGNAIPFLKSPTEDQALRLAEYTEKVKESAGKLQKRTQEASTGFETWDKSTSTTLAKTPAVTNSLVAYYPLDETQGDKTQSTLGKTLTGTIKGTSKWEQGRIGMALSLDGNTYVDCGTEIGFDRQEAVSYGAWVRPTTGDSMVPLSRMENENGNRGWDLFIGGGKVYVHLIHKWESNALRVSTNDAVVTPNQWTQIMVTYDGSSKAKGIKVYINGKSVALTTTHDTLTETILTKSPMLIGRRMHSDSFKGLIDEVRFYRRNLSSEEIEQIINLDTVRPILAVVPENRTSDQKKTVLAYYLENHDENYRQTNTEYQGWEKRRKDLDMAIPTTMIMQENAPDKMHQTHILIRGEYDKPGEKVTIGTPSFLPPLPSNAPNSRLGLAQWLVQPNHPLTSRVAINHFWQLIFGVGLVKTAEDFGMQGERPSHPELLDWLSTEFIQSGWNVKHIMRLLVTSAAYRQSSKVSPSLYQKDPENRLMARASRYRLTGEFIKDIALEASGLLVYQIGGPSVRPYHPAGLWEDIAFGGEFSAQTYVQDHGEALYRRGMYTFWKRTCPPPSLATFDAPEREFCIVRRSTTNTPLQALVLMNDPTFVEAARKLAERIMLEGGTATNQRTQFAYRLLLARNARPQEIKLIQKALLAQLEVFHKDPKQAEKLLMVGESNANEKLDKAELAAWTLVASLLLNLDETLTRG